MSSLSFLADVATAAPLIQSNKSAVDLVHRIVQCVSLHFPLAIRFFYGNKFMEGTCVYFAPGARRGHWEFVIQMPDPLTDVTQVREGFFTARILPPEQREMRTFTLAAFVGTAYYTLDDKCRISQDCHYKRSPFSNKSCVVHINNKWVPLGKFLPTNIRNLSDEKVIEQWLTEFSVGDRKIVEPTTCPEIQVRANRSSLMGRGPSRPKETKECKQVEKDIEKEDVDVIQNMIFYYGCPNCREISQSKESMEQHMKENHSKKRRLN